MDTRQMHKAVAQGELDGAFAYLYGRRAPEQPQRYLQVLEGFESLFGAGRQVRLFSAPGRSELGGNHTDHQHGRVLEAGIDLDLIAAAAPNGEQVIRSSSAAFEVAVGTMLNHLYAQGRVDPVTIAQIGQYAENVYFGKPSGLSDQTASSVGGCTYIDFADPQHPVVERVDFDFANSGHQLCVVDTGGNHADLTDDYAAAPVEMRSVAAALGKEVLRQVDPAEFYAALPRLRGVCSDRALLRAFHFFGDNARVPRQAAALRAGDFETFRRLVIESGRSSYMYLQNVYTCQNPAEQGLSLALAMSEQLLGDRGAWRVHGGGFAGTIQVYVPLDLMEAYRSAIEAVFGPGSCHMLSVRPVGGVEVTPALGMSQES